MPKNGDNSKVKCRIGRNGVCVKNADLSGDIDMWRWVCDDFRVFGDEIIIV